MTFSASFAVCWIILTLIKTKFEEQALVGQSSRSDNEKTTKVVGTTFSERFLLVEVCYLLVHCRDVKPWHRRH